MLWPCSLPSLAGLGDTGTGLKLLESSRETSEGNRLQECVDQRPLTGNDMEDKSFVLMWDGKL